MKRRLDALLLRGLIAASVAVVEHRLRRALAKRA
jgi:hypothetical protein